MGATSSSSLLFCLIVMMMVHLPDLIMQWNWNWITHVVAPRGSKRQNEPLLDEHFLRQNPGNFLWYFLLSDKEVVFNDHRPRSSDVWDKYYVPIQVSRQVCLPSSASTLSDCSYLSYLACPLEVRHSSVVTKVSQWDRSNFNVNVDVWRILPLK